MFGRAINNWYQLVKTSSLTKPQRRQLQKDVQDRFQVRNEKPCLLYCRNILEMDWNLVKGRGSNKYCKGLHAVNWVHSALQTNIDMSFTNVGGTARSLEASGSKAD